VRTLFYGVGVLLTILPTAAGAQSLLKQLEGEVTAIVTQARGGAVTIEDSRAADTGPVKSGAEPGKPLLSPKGEVIEQDASVKKPVAPGKIGSGFVIETGFVITTADVLEGMERPVIVTDSGSRYRATVVNIDHELNIGLLRLPEAAKIAPLKLGVSSGAQSGQFAIAIGNQVGQPNAVALTVISGFRREGSFAGRRFYPTLMQVAGSLGAGSSGAPLLNSRAEVIGMLVAVAPGADPKNPGQGSGGYALPIDDVKSAARLMMNVKRYLRAWLGADLREEARVEDHPDGSVKVLRSVWVETVHPGSPAEKAGMRRGDLFLSMSGTPVPRMGDVRAAVVRLKWGEKLSFTLRRDGKDVTAVVPFSMRPSKDD
jgi:serine protease Do